MESTAEDLQQTARYRVSYILWLARELRKDGASLVDQATLMLEAAAALEQLVGGASE